MTRRLIAVLLALVLAVAGAAILFVYVSGADQRAMQGLEPVSVLEVVQPVSEGTPAEGLADLVTVTELPADAVAEGALSSLDEVSGQVTTTDLQPGEQLLAARFTDPETFEDSQGIEVPEDLHQVSVLLDPSRVLGGFLEPGATVGVFASMVEPAQTRLVVNKALVTRVQGGIGLPEPVPDPAGEAPPTEGANPEAALPPGEGLLVTVAVEVGEAEEFVFAAEHGTIWLSIQPEEAQEGSDRTVDREVVFP